MYNDINSLHISGRISAELISEYSIVCLISEYVANLASLYLTSSVYLVSLQSLSALYYKLF
jgi:hypothetical protein